MHALPCQDPIGRRSFLQLGGLAMSGLTLAHVLAGRAAAGNAARPTSVILLYLHGGPSHLETYDLKMEAPSEYRSVFQPIATNVPGMEICEWFPRQARIADKFSLVRSLNHDVNIHSDGGIIVLTGKRPTVLDPTSQSKSEHPDLGSVASRLRGLGNQGMPPYVAIPQAMYMTRPTYLGTQHAAFAVGDPSLEGFRPPLARPATDGDLKQLARRHDLLSQIDTAGRTVAAPQAAATEKFRELAFELLASSAVTEAFDLAREPAALRDRYGQHQWGQGCLLARRLAEAGTAVVTLYINTPFNGPEYTNWDDHILNAGRPGHFAEYMRRRLPPFDQALSALIEDIFARGIDRQVLVVAVGEFGRTPRLSQNASGVGRDHWPQAYTALVSGGGLRMGQVVGATNSKGEYPTERPYSPQDLLATIYRHLGIDWHQAFLDPTGRPTPILSQGEPIRELV